MRGREGGAPVILVPVQITQAQALAVYTHLLLMSPPRLPLVRIRRGLFLVAIMLAQLGTLSGETLCGSVTCLDCAAGHDLSGVVVAVQCRGVEGDSAAETDGGGNFVVAMPVAPVSWCAAC